MGICCIDVLMLLGYIPPALGSFLAHIMWAAVPLIPSVVLRGLRCGGCFRQGVSFKQSFVQSFVQSFAQSFVQSLVQSHVQICRSVDMHTFVPAFN